MLTLGVSGGLDLMSEHREYLFPPGTCHDSAAVLVEDGRVIAAIEEERLNRIKHTSKGATNAIRYCLDAHSITLDDLAAVVYYGAEDTCALWMRNLFYGSRDAEPVTTYRQLIHEMMQRGVGETLDDRKLMFVHHHLAHAISAFGQSGLEESLVVTIDGAGDGLSGSVTHWRDSQYRLLATYDAGKSLGILYDRVIAMIGYGFTEEYKVMGLAPYGDPARFRRAFAALYTLLPDGDYLVNWNSIETLYPLAPVRKKGDPILQEHKDIAAALQEALERIVFHMLSYFRVTTGLTSLCLAGGVAHNSTLNGRILYSGMFRDVFVQPASHDAGCAVGAALYPFMLPGAAPSAVSLGAATRADHVYWGTPLGSDADIGAALERWSALIEVTPEGRVAERAAELLADGEVIGWVNGRSEFGPRALGNRSIIADPRPASHKDLINRMVKKREGYRPFAPAVLEEYTTEYFETPAAGTRYPFMSFTLRVRPEYRDVLGATTHIDHTARVQTVAQSTNPRFWELIDAFRQRTGIAVVLNTSFNNNAEPIVDSVDDAVACFLTTGLNHLVVGDYLIAKRAESMPGILELCASLPAYSRLTETTGFDDVGQLVVTNTIANTYDNTVVPISVRLFQLLRQGRYDRPLRDILPPSAGREERAELTAELWSLWERRVVLLRPVERAPVTDAATDVAVGAASL